MNEITQNKLLEVLSDDETHIGTIVSPECRLQKEDIEKIINMANMTDTLGFVFYCLDNEVRTVNYKDKIDYYDFMNYGKYGSYPVLVQDYCREYNHTNAQHIQNIIDDVLKNVDFSTLI